MYYSFFYPCSLSLLLLLYSWVCVFPQPFSFRTRLRCVSSVFLITSRVYLHLIRCPLLFLGGLLLFVSPGRQKTHRYLSLYNIIDSYIILYTPTTIGDAFHSQESPSTVQSCRCTRERRPRKWCALTRDFVVRQEKQKKKKARHKNKYSEYNI